VTPPVTEMARVVRPHRAGHRSAGVPAARKLRARLARHAAGEPVELVGLRRQPLLGEHQRRAPNELVSTTSAPARVASEMPRHDVGPVRQRFSLQPRARRRRNRRPRARTPGARAGGAVEDQDAPSSDSSKRLRRVSRSAAGAHRHASLSGRARRRHRARVLHDVEVEERARRRRAAPSPGARPTPRRPRHALRGPPRPPRRTAPRDVDVEIARDRGELRARGQDLDAGDDRHRDAAARHFSTYEK